MRNGLTQNRGAHIVIEYTSELPNVISEGISVSPGAETMVSLKKLEISRLKDVNYGNCTDEILDSGIKAMYPPEFKYSAKSCNAFCLIVNTMRECNCMKETEVGGIMLHNYDELKKDKPRCMTNSKCMGNPEDWFKPCSCNAECYDTLYQVIDHFILNMNDTSSRSVCT